MNAFLQLRGVRKSFGEQPVLKGVSLDVDEGEILVLLGPSGSGKTTLLRLIAGFEAPDAGSIRVAGREIAPLPPNRRNFGMVFQHYALFPHLTVGRNVAFGLESRGLSPAEIGRRVSELLPLVDLEGFESRRVHEISGGQQQRVALARALAPEPQVLLLDEPLSNLDPALRERTRRQLVGIIERVGITAVWVTHEQEEAFDVGHWVALLNRGRLEQVGRAEDLYLEPASRFVAEFVGLASALKGVAAEGGRVRLGTPGRATEEISWEGTGGGNLEVDAPVEVVFRPEGLRLAAPDTGGVLPGRIVDRRYAGEVTYYGIELEEGSRLLVSGSATAGSVGDRVGVALDPDGPLPRVFPFGAGEES